MRGAATLCLLTAVAGAQEAAAAEGAGSAAGRARVAIAAPAGCYVGEAVSLALRVELDAAWFDEHTVELFRQPLDVPVAIDVGWFHELAGAAAVPTPAREGRLERLVVDGKAVQALRAPDVEREGRTYWVLQCERRVAFAAAGVVELAGPRLQFAWASGFVDDIVQGRTPVDRHVVAITGESASIAVRELPAAGRPERFDGAIGEFSLRATIAPREVAVGGQIQLQLTVAGDGNLQSVRAPRLDHLTGLHVLGVIEQRDPARLLATYDLEVLDAALAAVPAIELPFFAPGSGEYRVARSAPQPLTVHPGAGAVRSPREPVPGPGATDTTPTTPDASGALTLAAQAAVSIAVLGLCAWLALRQARGRGRRRGRATATDPAAARAAVLAFGASVEAGGDGLAARFDEVLAAHLGAPVVELDRAALRERLVAAGVGEELAQRAVRQRESLAAASYAGISAGAAVVALHLVEELDAVLRQATRT